MVICFFDVRKIRNPMLESMIDVEPGHDNEII